MDWSQVMRFILIVLIVLSTSAFAKKKGKIIYKYKKYEKFDMDDLNIAGDTSNPGDLSINPRFRRKYKNTLPSKPNFNRELRKSILSLK
jgi:hypothetical protein